ncbi:MAG: asparagine synthase (glutamine-hydrolyzing) [Betaproteobacteria bacterium]|nr:MAG: asparagine synthase (glutamine-hydrolyzing) [Betaproteobacteria bacterium]
MAGIAGWIALARQSCDEGALGAMAGALAHRGVQELYACLHHGGRQQVALGASLVDPAARIALVLDGSVANAAELRAALGKHGYRFAADTPEELLLRAYQHWDKDVAKQLRGAFAFAIWDARKERLLLTRDRFGEKPLYLHEKRGALYFASEPKALLKAGISAQVDLSAVWDCLAYRYVPGPRTLFAGIRKLPPASALTWQFGSLREVRYWTAPDGNPSTREPLKNDLTSGFIACLEEAVKLRAAGGLFLSGGLDSAVLAALMSRAGGKLKTFSLGFEGDAASELPSAAQIAKHFGTAHHEVVVAPRELIPSLAKLVASRDAPVSRPSDLAVYRLACEAARGAKSVLTGDGCDEVLGGYRRYLAEAMSGGVESFPARLLAPLVSAGRFDTAAAALRLNGWRNTLFTVEKAMEKGPQAPAQQHAASRLRRALYADQTSWLPDQLLERNDRAAAAAGIDARMPFLDHRLAEYVSALPDQARVRGLTTKWILREAARRLIPRELQRRPKSGWRLDAGAWLRNDLREFTREHLQGGSSVTRQYYDGAALDRVLDDHLKGKKNHEILLWTLLNIEIWHRAYAPG